MSEHTDDISKHIRGYLIIGGTLIIGTVLTVLASYVDLGHHWIIATVKASLVALYFMHLISEKQMIYTVLAFTAFFFVGLMFLTIAAYNDHPALTTTL